MIKPLIYKDVDPKRYLISDNGEVFKANGKKLKGCNPKNENGYIRVTLMSINGKLKKYPIHRLVMSSFVGDSDLYVDHINGDKTCNKLSNLEYVTAKENSIRSVNLGLSKTCDSHWKAVLNNSTVNEICKLFQDGYNVRKIEKMLKLDNIPNIDKILTDILYHKSWKKISNNYNWDLNTIRYKKYKYDDLYHIAKLILSNKYKTHEIADMFDQYDRCKLIQVIKKMKQGKLYKEILKEAKRSTTIVDEHGFIHVHRR